MLSTKLTYESRAEIAVTNLVLDFIADLEADVLTDLASRDQLQERRGRIEKNMSNGNYARACLVAKILLDDIETHQIKTDAPAKLVRGFSRLLDLIESLAI